MADVAAPVTPEEVAVSCARREEATDPASAGLSTNWLTDYAEI